MPFTTLVSTSQVFDSLNEERLAIVDCRFDLKQTGRGRADYQTHHIPTAVYAHLDDDLSGAVIPGRSGRHPLPEPAALAERFSAWGIGDGVQVVAYDDAGGAMAARLWWMLRWLGHVGVAVLDGGWPRWVAEGRPVRSGVERRAPRKFVARVRTEGIANAEEVDRIRNDEGYILFDARSADRFRGENETIDPVAGHIPGARSLPFADNLDPDGLFWPADTLRRRYEKAMGAVPAERTVFYCGSGVTAAHDILAMEHAGLGEARLYPGSWSEWISDPRRPVAVGPGATA